MSAFKLILLKADYHHKERYRNPPKQLQKKAKMQVLKDSGENAT